MLFFLQPPMAALVSVIVVGAGYQSPIAGTSLRALVIQPALRSAGPLDNYMVVSVVSQDRVGRFLYRLVLFWSCEVQTVLVEKGRLGGSDRIQ